MKVRQILLIPLIALLVCIPAFSAQAQDETQPLDDEFIDALVMMAVNHDLMEGRNELSNLNALKDVVDEYFLGRIASGVDAATRVWIEEQQIKQANLIQARVDKVRTSLLAEIDGFMKLFTDARKLTILNKHFGLNFNESPPAEYLDNINAQLSADIDDQIIVKLDAHTIMANPSAASGISGSSGWSYNVPAITDSTAGIPSSGGDGSSSIGNDPPADPDEDNSDAQDVLRLKPLRFDNNGFEPVTVLVETYEPAPGLSPYVPDASTVVNPESNSSGYLNLPLGTYTFCYYWQLDEDYNNDDYFDYHHRTTSAYTLNVNSSDNVQSAIAVTLSPDSNVSNPNGKCGEVAQDNGNLTPEERANQGAHTYLISLYAPGALFHGETSTDTINVVFGETVQIGIAGNEQYILSPAGHNKYTWIDEDGLIQTFIFTLEGFEVYSKVTVSGELVDSKMTCILQD